MSNDTLNALTCLDPIPDNTTQEQDSTAQPYNGLASKSGNECFSIVIIELCK
jgi:hypothetical protein